MNDSTTHAESAVRFCRWFMDSYRKLKVSLHVRTASDEDVFHDTFLLMHRRILYQGDIVDYAPYFANAYHNNLIKRMRREGKFVYPDDTFFRTLVLMDENGQHENNERMIYVLAADVMKFVKSRFSGQDYEVFKLYVMENGFSAKVISDYTGPTTGIVYRTLSNIRKAILRNQDFYGRWKQFLLQSY